MAETSNLEAARAHFKDNGWVRIPSVLSKEQAAETLEKLWQAKKAAEARGDDTHLPYLDPNASNVRVFYLIELDQIFRELIFHPTALEMAKTVLGPGFIISNFTANIARPGSQSMALHSDQSLVFEEPWNKVQAMNVIWYVISSCNCDIEALFRRPAPLFHDTDPIAAQVPDGRDQGERGDAVHPGLEQGGDTGPAAGQRARPAGAVLGAGGRHHRDGRALVAHERQQRDARRGPRPSVRLLHVAAHPPAGQLGGQAAPRNPGRLHAAAADYARPGSGREHLGNRRLAVPIAAVSAGSGACGFIITTMCLDIWEQFTRIWDRLNVDYFKKEARYFYIGHLIVEFTVAQVRILKISM
jgi:hypothetical protein